MQIKINDEIISGSCESKQKKSHYAKFLDEDAQRFQFMEDAIVTPGKKLICRSLYKITIIIYHDCVFIFVLYLY